MRNLTQKALIIAAQRGALQVGTKPVPTPGANQLQIRIHATALNPADSQIRTYGFGVPAENYPTVLGLDSAGEVTGVGADVKGISIGDRIVHQGEYAFTTPDLGTFQQYTVAESHLIAKIPDDLSYESAAAVPLAYNTASIGMYQVHPHGAALTPPWEGGVGKYKGQPFVILGGASSVGQYIIQLARLSGFSPIITTASPHNGPLLESLGATHVLNRADYKTAASLTAVIKEITPSSINLVFETVGGEVQQLAYDILHDNGKLITIVPISCKEKEDSGKTAVLVWCLLSAPHHQPFAEKSCKALTQLLADGSVKPNQIEILPNGLHGIPDGLDRLKNKKVSGYKLVARPQET